MYFTNKLWGFIIKRGICIFIIRGAAMKTYKVAVIAGDGIGPEVIAEGVKVLRAVAQVDGGFAFEFTHYPWGCEYYLQNGAMMPQDGMEQ